MKLEKHALNNYPAMTDEGYNALVSSIKANGFNALYPIILYEGKILDGHHRYRACMELDIKFPTSQFKGGYGEAGAFVRSTNTRRDLEAGTKAACALENLEIASSLTKAKAEAKERQLATLKKGTVKPPSVTPTLEERAKPRAQREALAVVAKEAGVSRSTLAEVAKIKKEHPEKISAVAEGKKTLGEVKKEIRLEERAKKNEQIEKRNRSLPVEKRKYAVIYADPPWIYECNTENDRAVENHYPTMSLEKIKALPVRAISLQNAILFLWTTAPKILEAGEVISAWGFTYKTCAVWDKINIGLGSYFRIQHEILMIAIAGKMDAPPVETRPTWSILKEKRRGHSEKPEVFYGIIEKMYPGAPRIELFSRTKRDGWDAWGNQS